jgi:hypothetical protein
MKNNEQIKSEVSLAIVLACMDLSESFSTDSTEPISNLFSASIKLALTKTIQKHTNNLNQEGLNIVGELLSKNKNK